MDVSVVVPLQGGPDQALRCFEALAGLPPSPEHEVVVVDDASAGLESLLARLGGEVTVVRSAERLGFARAVRLGAERARGDVLAFVRDAVEVGHGWLAPLVAALADDAVRLAASGTGHPVTARAFAIRRADAGALETAARVPEDQQVGALCVELGTAVAVPASELRPPRPVSARRAPGEEPELTIVIPTLDAASERVRGCVRAVQSGTDAPHEIVLVDNGAPPQGFSAPVNSGLRAARGGYAVVMNDDVEVLPGWWGPLREALDAGATVTFPFTIDSTARRDFSPWCFAMSRASMERFAHAPGEFYDPELRVWYQDTDLHRRLIAAGAAPLLVESSRIRHGLSETLTSEDPELSAWIEEQIARDREKFTAKHPDAQLTVVELATP